MLQPTDKDIDLINIIKIAQGTKGAKNCNLATMCPHGAVKFIGHLQGNIGHASPDLLHQIVS